MNPQNIPLVYSAYHFFFTIVDPIIGRNEVIEKMETQRLLGDMTILLKLVKQTDEVFAMILQSYYAMQVYNS